MTIKQLSEEDLDPHQRRMLMEIMSLRSANAERIEKIESYGSVVDVATGKMEHLIASLMHFGILNADQVLEMYRDWELELSRQSKGLLINIQERVAEARRKAAAPRLIIPGQN